MSQENLPELSFDIEGRPNYTLIKVQILSPKINLPETTCITCGNIPEIRVGIENFPYRDLGFGILFNNVPEYHCRHCGLVTTSNSIGHVLEVALSFIWERLGNNIRYYSSEELQKVLTEPLPPKRLNPMQTAD